MRKHLYTFNQDFEFFSELRTLVLKPSLDEKRELAKKISRVGRVKLALISGIFLNPQGSAAVGSSTADLFIVANSVNRRKLNRCLKAIEAEVGTEIRFGIMNRKEFEYRYGMFDRFVRVLLESPHEKIINKLKLRP